MNLAAVLSRVAAREGGKPAVIERAQSVSYRQLWREVEHAARRLAIAGVCRGDRVAIALPNGASFLQYLFGAMMLRAIAVPVRTDYSRHELAHIMTNAAPKAFVSEAAWLGEHSWLAKELLKDAVLIDAHARPLHWEALPRDWTEASHEPALIGYAYTGAGEALGAVHTHRSCTLAGIAYGRHIGIRRDDRVLFTLPMPNAFTLAGCVFAPLLRGATLVIENDFIPKILLAAIARGKVTILTGVPDIFRLLAYCYDRRRHDASSLRLMITGGAYMPADDHLEIEQKLGVRMVQGYGLTECFPVLCNPPDDGNRPGSIGVAGRDVRIRIVGEQGEDVGVGEVGEILVRCPFLMQGYYGRAEQTARVLQGGWLHTGDLGHVDEEGYYYFDGLKKSLINLHGNKIDPAEVEKVLLSCPGVSGAEVVCDGGSVYNGKGLKVRARVRLSGDRPVDAKAVREFCKERIALYKVPAFVDILP